jgi:hypothetical protein
MSPGTQTVLIVAGIFYGIPALSYVLWLFIWGRSQKTWAMPKWAQAVALALSYATFTGVLIHTFSRP